MIYIVTGKRNVGKTSQLKEIVGQLENCSGVLSVKAFDGEVFRGYDLDLIGSNRQLPFIRNDLSKGIELGDETIGDFLVLKEGILEGRKTIEASIENEQDTVIDEVAQLELKDKVFAEQVRRAVDLQNSGANWDLYLVVREDLLELVISTFNILIYKLIRVGREEVK